MEASPVKRILVPLALDAGEALTLAHAARLARADHGTIFLLHVLNDGDAGGITERVTRESLCPVLLVSQTI
jgi:hypothetical protein